MKPLLQIVVLIVLSFVLQYFLPWWTVALACAGVGYVFQSRPWVSFLLGFAAVGMLWWGMAFWIDIQTQSVLTTKINQLLPLPALVLTALVGGLVGGFATLTGALAATKPRRKW